MKRVVWSQLSSNSQTQNWRALRTFPWTREKDLNSTFSSIFLNVCTRDHSQIQVIKRFRHTLSDSTKARLYKAFIMPRFQYCSSIWHFCGARNSEKLWLFNKHVLRIILDDKASTYEVLLESLDLVNLRKRRFLDMWVLVHKSFRAAAPVYMYISVLFTPRTNINA